MAQSGLASTLDTDTTDGNCGVVERVTRVSPRPSTVRSARHRGLINDRRSVIASTNYPLAPDVGVADDTAPHMDGDVSFWRTTQSR